MFEPEQIFAHVEGLTPSSNSICILFSGKDVLVTDSFAFPSLSEAAALFPELPLLHAGTLNGVPCFGAECPSFPAALPRGLRTTLSRHLLVDAGADVWGALCRVRELSFWRRYHKFCGGCGAVLKPSETDTALVCPACRARYFPQISPAVIVAIRRNGELLLAHNKNFEYNVHSLIAGFVEAGETAEQAVEREVAEETSLKVTNIRYIASQTWPFPNSLMLAFEADYLSGEATPDGTELTSLGWYRADNLPSLPMHGSIARLVIDRIFPSASLLL